MYQLNGLAWCLLGCNFTEVAVTGDDPCAAGSIESDDLGGGLHRMQCYNLGTPLLSKEPDSIGACGYNCSLVRYDDRAAPCSQKELDAGLCSTVC
jgi:hypothetical protein